MGRKSGKKRILFLVQLPPPIHGVSIMNKMVWANDDLLPGWEKELLELSFSRSTKQLRRFTLLKLFRFMIIFIHLLWKCTFRKYQYVYFTIVPTLPGFFRDLFFILVVKMSRATPIYHLHLMGIRKTGQKNLIRKLYQWTFSNAVVIHLSEHVYLSEFSDLKLKNHHHYIQPNGIPVTIHPVRKKKSDNLHILHLSHLYRFKGLYVLLEAFHELICKGYDIHLDIVGDQADKEVYRKIIEYDRQSGMSNRITWHGLQTGQAKHDIIAGADIMTLPTMNDTFPLTILEAMQYGLPVIASRKGAIPEMLDDGESGYLIDPGDLGQLKKKLQLLIRDPELREKIGAQACKKYKENFTDKHFYEGMKKIFRNVL